MSSPQKMAACDDGSASDPGSRRLRLHSPDTGHLHADGTRYVPAPQLRFIAEAGTAPSGDQQMPTGSGKESAQAGSLLRFDAPHVGAQQAGESGIAANSTPHFDFNAASPTGAPVGPSDPVGPGQRRASRSDTSSSEHAAMTGPFQVHWEVDRFTWPDVCSRLVTINRDCWTSLTERVTSHLDNRRNVIAVVSCHPQDGRTTFTICLARRLAQAGINVALVDADVENPDLAGRLHVKTDVDWIEAICESGGPGTAAVKSLAESVTVFPLGPLRKADEGSFGSASVTGDLVEHLAPHFDAILIDTSPILTASGPAKWNLNSTCVGGIVAVRNVESTSDEQVRSALGSVAGPDVPRIGVIENFVHP